MVKRSDYDAIIKEHFNISDTETRKTLLSINENEKNEILLSLTGRLYDNIINKVDDIDFGNIPDTRGDITKIENYDKLLDSLELLQGIVQQYRQESKSVTIVQEALDNVIVRRDLFEKAFSHSVELPMVIYSTITLSIVSSISFLISTCVEFIKLPNNESFDIVVNKVGMSRSKDSLLISNLDKFNKSCTKGQMDKTIDYVINSNTDNFVGASSTVMGGMAVVGLILSIVPIMRELIFFFYYTRTQVSDYFEIQADVLQINAYNVKENDIYDKKTRNDMHNKQMGIVKKFRKVSDFFAIKVRQGDKKATNEASKESRKHTTKELTNSMPDSAGARNVSSSASSSIF